MSFPFIFSFMPEPSNSLDLIRITITKPKGVSSYLIFFFFLSSFISIVSLYFIGLIRNDSIISVAAIQYRWIYTIYILLPFHFPMQFGILKGSILCFSSQSLNKSGRISYYVCYYDSVFLEQTSITKMKKKISIYFDYINYFIALTKQKSNFI